MSGRVRAEQDRRERRRLAQQDFDVLADELADLPGVDRAAMFGSLGIRVGGKFLAFVGAEGELIVKLPQPRVDELVASGAGGRVTIGRNPAREWIGVPPAPDGGDDLWRSLLREAYRYAAAGAGLRNSSINAG